MTTPLYIRQLAVGPMENFVYLVGGENAKEVAVVDCAWDAGAIARAAEEDKKEISCIILTHSHFDHMNATGELLGLWKVPVYAQREEVVFSAELRALAAKAVEPGARVAVGPLEVTLLHTPGHTPGSHCVLAGDAVFTGDTVFVNACGRCDLPGGDAMKLRRSIVEVLMKLPDETRLFPGHDYGDVPVSSIGRERRLNPYFQLA